MAKLPDGDPAPATGTLPESVRQGANSRPFGVYVHVPYCRVRCGYCDFNTYTASELRGTSQASFSDEACREIAFAARVLEQAELPAREVSTVFFGGGTPTLLPPQDLARMLSAIRETWGIKTDAEVTVEANPDTVTEQSLTELAAAGFTRVSFGMQSAVPRILRVLDRTHEPARLPDVVRWARQAGLQVSVDIIYGAPGETLAEWEQTVTAACELAPDHISAYALIVEEGTRLAAQIRRGELAQPSDDLQAEMYELADARFAAAGYGWYEISNWARGEAYRSRHNLSYWLGHDWWGFGPGAHSHVGGVRWWNVKHPAAYAQRIAAGLSPALAREILTAEQRFSERLLLETRISAGFPAADLPAAARPVLAGLVADGLVDGRLLLAEGRVVPTLRGRLLADTVVQRLLAACE